MRVCAACGSTSTESDNFCPKCGKSLTVGESAVSPNPLTSKQKFSDPTIRKGIVALFQLLIAAAAFFYIYIHFIHHSNSPTPTNINPSSVSNSVANRKIVIFSGSGGLNEQTAPQELSGNYEITWTTFGQCTYYASIGSTDIFSADSATSGTNYLNNLTDGNYSVSMITGPAPDCSWSAKFTPTK